MNILLIKHGAFGDIIQADGIFRDIRQHYPAAHISLLTSPAFEDLMQRSPYIDQVFTDERVPLWRFKYHYDLLKSLSQKKIDLVIDLQNSNRSHLYRRLGLKQAVWQFRAGKLTSSSALRGLQTQLEQAGVETHYALRPDLSWMVDDISALLERYQVLRRYIVLIPGCSMAHPEKRWPHYAALAELLLNEGYDVVKIIGPDEKALSAEIPGHNLAGDDGILTWFELAGVLKSAAFIVGNDTGPSHVASCLNQRGLALFGPTTSAKRTEINRGDFRAWETSDLHQLSSQTVFNHIIEQVA